MYDSVLCCIAVVLHCECVAAVCTQQLTAKVDLSEVQGLNAVLGDYVTRYIPYSIHISTAHYFFIAVCTYSLYILYN
jgi:hypothetical protein